MLLSIKVKIRSFLGIIIKFTIVTVFCVHIGKTCVVVVVIVDRSSGGSGGGVNGSKRTPSNPLNVDGLFILLTNANLLTFC